MFIIAIIGINVVLISIWSVKNKQNGFAEIPKLLRGEPAFVSTSIYPIEQNETNETTRSITGGGIQE